MKDHSISVDQDRYATYIVAKYLDNDIFKTSTKFYKTTFPSDMIFTKDDTSTSDEKVEKLTREFNNNYIYFNGSFIYFLPTRVDLSFALHRFEMFSENPGKVHFEGLVHLLRFIRYNNTLDLKYYSDMNDAPVTDLLRRASIKTKNHLMDFYDSSWQDCPDNGRSTGAYIIFYQGGSSDRGTHVPGLVAQSSKESEYNAAYKAGMALAHFSMLIHELLNKDPDIVQEEAPLIVLDSKSYMCLSNNGKDTKHTR